MIRTRFILRPGIQIKYMLITLGVICMTGFAVYYVFWSSLVNSAGLEELSSGEWIALERAYNSSFFWVILILSLVSAIASIFLFHKLIGPVYVFQRAIKSLSGGDLTVALHTRRKDELKDLLSELQAMISNMRTAVKDDRDKIDEIKHMLDKSDISGAREKLSALTRWYKLD